MRSGVGGPCCHCGRTHSPCWRKGPPGKPTLCNACGARYLVKRSLDGYMPGARAAPSPNVPHHLRSPETVHRQALLAMEKAAAAAAAAASAAATAHAHTESRAHRAATVAAALLAADKVATASANSGQSSLTKDVQQAVSDEAGATISSKRSRLALAASPTGGDASPSVPQTPTVLLAPSTDGSPAAVSSGKRARVVATSVYEVDPATASALRLLTTFETDDGLLTVIRRPRKQSSPRACPVA